MATKLTGASSWVVRLGELDCTNDETFIIDFLALPEPALFLPQVKQYSFTGTLSLSLTSALSKRATSDSNIPILDCRALMVLSRYEDITSATLAPDKMCAHPPQLISLSNILLFVQSLSLADEGLCECSLSFALHTR
jgi:hypothetical protein